jgi:hypothetical protein
MKVAIAEIPVISDGPRTDTDFVEDSGVLRFQGFSEQNIEFIRMRSR